MNQNSIFCVFAILIGSTQTVTVAQEKKPNNAIIGVWTVVESKLITSGGRLDSMKEDTGKTVRFDEKWFVFPGVLREQYVIDSKKNPPQINIFDPKRGSNERDCLLGIYKTSETELTLIWSKKEGGLRPESFEWPPKNRKGLFYLSLKRASDAKNAKQNGVREK